LEADKKIFAKFAETRNILARGTVNNIANLPTLFSPPPPQGGGALFVQHIFSWPEKIKKTRKIILDIIWAVW